MGGWVSRCTASGCGCGCVDVPPPPIPSVPVAFLASMPMDANVPKVPAPPTTQSSRDFHFPAAERDALRLRSSWARRTSVLLARISALMWEKRRRCRFLGLPMLLLALLLLLLLLVLLVAVVARLPMLLLSSSCCSSSSSSSASISLGSSSSCSRGSSSHSWGKARRFRVVLGRPRSMEELCAWCGWVGSGVRRGCVGWWAWRGAHIGRCTNLARPFFSERDLLVQCRCRHRAHKRQQVMDVGTTWGRGAVFLCAWARICPLCLEKDLLLPLLLLPHLSSL